MENKQRSPNNHWTEAYQNLQRRQIARLYLKMVGVKSFCYVQISDGIAVNADSVLIQNTA